MAASEKKLGDLHTRLADVFIGALDRAEAAAVIEPDEEELAFATEINPALLNAASKFLKDNEITCSGGEGSKAEELREKFAKRKQVGNVVHIAE